MPDRYAVLLFLLLTAPVRAEVFTWTDGAGVRHYGDRPPADLPAETIELDQQPLSTIGNSGIRAGERELLDRVEAAEAARLQAAAEAAARRPPPVVVTLPPTAPPERIVYSRPLPWWTYHRQRQTFWGFDLNLGRLSIQGGQFDPGPPFRPGHRPPPVHPSPPVHRPPQGHRPPPAPRPNPTPQRVPGPVPRSPILTPPNH
jgi:hypothetical protein